MKHLYYLWYVLRHKWFVLLACWSMGLRWRGLVHDWHKFLPSEWTPYVEHFHGSKKPKEPRDSTGYYKPTDTGDPAFDFAWLLHQKRADHHWQWWILPEDKGGLKILPMSETARWEMLCDWYGAGRAQLREKHQGWKSTKEWYENNRDKMQLHAETRHLIETFLRNAVEG